MWVSGTSGASKEAAMPLAGDAKRAAPDIPACSQPSIVAYIVPRTASETRMSGNLSDVLTDEARRLVGVGSRLTLPQAAPIAAAPLQRGAAIPTVGAPSGGIAIELGGAVAGKTSCDFTLADHPEAARLSTAGAATLKNQGLPLSATGFAPGEQRFLVRSAAFTPGLAYILYVVPDPASISATKIGGLPVYERNMYALAAIEPNGSTRFASVVDR